jgi:DNA polymerase
MNNYVPGYGSSSAKLVIVGEAPGAHEVDKGYPFAGPSGHLVDQALACTPLSRNDVYMTNVVKVRPPNNKLSELHLIGHTVEEFLPQLWLELEQINPNCILAFGDTALQALTSYKGIMKYRGSILLCSKTGQKVVPTIHPAAILHGEGNGNKLHPYKEFSWIKNDVVRAYEQSLFREYRPPDRNLHVAQSSNDVARFLDRHVKQDMVTLDVETIKTYAQCIGLSFNSWEAISIPLFNDGDEVGEIPSSDQALIWRILAEFLQDTKIKIMAQNAKFDEKRCRQIGLKWHDCWFDMGMGWHILFPEFPKKLQFISSVLTDEPYYKDEGTEFNSKDKKANFRQWLLYNAKDAAVEMECCIKILQQLKDWKLYDFFFDKIMPLHRLYSNIEDIGILVAQDVRKHLRAKYRNLWTEKQALLVSNIADGDPQIKELYKNFNVMSNGPKNQVAKLVFGYLKCPVRKDTGDDTLKSLANNTIKDKRRKDILLGILEVRKLRKTIGTYIDAKLSQDGRVHTQCNINGTETGRTSTGILKPPVSIEKEGIALQTMTKHEDITLDAGGSDLRSLFIADPGFSFIEPDLSQAEDRVVCVLARDWDALKAYERVEFKRNQHGLKDDRHTKTAMAVCGLDFEAVTDWERQVGKKTRHAGNYAVGKHQHMLTLSKAGIFISEYMAGKQLEKFHADNSKIKGVFHQEIIDALQANDCVLYTPFGRRRQFFNRFGEEMFKEAFAYIPQSTISDQVKFAMLRIKGRLAKYYMKDFFFLEESHDSFLALCRDELIREAAQIIKEEMMQPIDFKTCTLSRDYILIIPSDTVVGKRWISKSNEYPDGMCKYRATE